MSRFKSAVLTCVLTSAAALHAQSQAVPATRSTAPSSSTITVVGCVQEAVADGSLGGTPLGTTATPANAGVVANVQPPIEGFLLTAARPAGRSAPGAPSSDTPAPTGTSGATDASKEELTTYALEGNNDELATHRGHRVEVTGTLAPPASSGVNRPAGSKTDPFQTGVQRLRVQTLRMVAASCQEK